MFDVFYEFKKWWFGLLSSEDDAIEEFIRMESKHTRVHHDEDIYEQIRVH